MKTREKIELGLIPLAVVLVGWSSSRLPARLGVGALLVIACLGWLVQGGVRDLWLLYLTKTRADSAPRRKVACMCVESTFGLTGLLVGLGLALAGLGGEVMLTPSRWMILTAAVLAVGFAAKDYVIGWRPLGIRREPEHHSFIFTWR